MKKEIRLLLFVAVISSVLLYAIWLINANFNILDDYWEGRSAITIQHYLERFKSWSQRLPIDVTTVLLLKNVIVAKISVLLCFVLLIATFAKVLHLQKFTQYVLVVGCICLFNVFEFEGTGTFTTICNYLFVATTSLLTYCLLINQIANKALRLSCNYLLLPCLAFFSTAHELIAIGFIIALPFIYLLNRRNLLPHLIVLLIAVGNLILFFKSGVTTFRYCLSVKTVFPTFNLITTLTKLYLGSASTLLYYFAYNCAFSILLFGSLILCLFKDKLNLVKAICVFALLFGIQYVLSLFNTELNTLLFKFTYNSSEVDFNSKRIIALFAISVVFCLMFLVGVYKLKCERRTKMIFLGLVVLGFIIRMAMSFSPTLFFSLAKTFFFTNTLFLIASLYLLSKFNVLEDTKVVVFIVACILSFSALRVAYFASDNYVNGGQNTNYKRDFTEQYNYCSIKVFNIPTIQQKREFQKPVIKDCFITDANGNKQPCTQEDIKGIIDSEYQEFLKRDYQQRQQVFKKARR